MRVQVIKRVREEEAVAWLGEQLCTAEVTGARNTRARPARTVIEVGHCSLVRVQGGAHGGQASGREEQVAPRAGALRKPFLDEQAGLRVRVLKAAALCIQL